MYDRFYDSHDPLLHRSPCSPGVPEGEGFGNYYDLHLRPVHYLARVPCSCLRKLRKREERSACPAEPFAY